MSRFAFIAAATLFTGLLVVLTMAIAQRDARGTRTIADIAPSAYSELRAEPIQVDSHSIGPDGGIEAPQDSSRADAAQADQPWIQSNQWPQPPVVRGNDSTIPKIRELPPLPSDESLPDNLESSLPSIASLPNLPSDRDPQNTVSLPVMSASLPNSGGLPDLASMPNSDDLPSTPNTRSTYVASNNEDLNSLTDVQPETVVLASGQNPIPTAPPPAILPPLAEPPRLDASRFAPPTTSPTELPTASNAAAPRSTSPPPNTSNPLPSANLLAPLPVTQPSSQPPTPLTNQPTLQPPAVNAPSLSPSLNSPTLNAPVNAPTSNSPTLSAPSANNPVGNNPVGNSPSLSPPPSSRSIPESAPTRSSSPSDPPSIVGFPSFQPDASQNRAPSNWSMVTPIPGARQFDGSQNPSLEIHKRAPSEVQVGIPATFTAVVRNVGNSTAFDVQVTDAIPKGARLVRSMPEAQRVGNEGLLWNLGELAAGQEVAISMEIVPETEGELGSVASVKFAAQASVRTISTQPRLSIKQTTAPEVLGGNTTMVYIDITNTGSGTAKDVRLEEDVPGIFRHLTGASALQQDVGDLAPGETLRFEIELTALAAGKANNIVRATSSNSALAESATPIEIKAPKLQMQLVGPKLRHLERPAPYEAVIENVGTALARDLYITARLPRGMNFISATNEGTYLPDQHAVVWNLLELAAGTKAKTEVTLLPVEEGRFTLLMSTEAEGLRADPVEREVLVEGQSELVFDIEDDNDPIETSGVTTYAVKINNIGTRPDQEVRLVIEVPEGASVDQVFAPMKYQSTGRQIVFAPIPSLASKEQITVKVSIKHGREGTQILRAAIQSQLRPVPVIRDESTQVYRDQ